MFRRRHRYEEFLAAHRFSDALVHRFRRHHTVGGPDADLVFAALRQWFDVCRRTDGAFVAMPARSVDEAWHDFILFTREYIAFCHGAFGAYLHHTPTAGLGAAHPDELMAAGLARAWHLACASEGRDPASAADLPLLFAIDERVRWSGGVHHRLDDMRTGARAIRLRDLAPAEIGVGRAPTFVAAGRAMGDCVGGAGDPGSGMRRSDGDATPGWAPGCGGAGCGGGCGGG